MHINEQFTLSPLPGTEEGRVWNKLPWTRGLVPAHAALIIHHRELNLNIVWELGAQRDF